MSVFLGHKYGWVPLNILPKIALNYNLVENSIGFEYKGAEGKGKTEGFRFLVDNELPSFGREDQQLMSTKQQRHKCGPTVGRAVFATPASSFLFCSGGHTFPERHALHSTGRCQHVEPLPNLHDFLGEYKMIFHLVRSPKAP